MSQMLSVLAIASILAKTTPDYEPSARNTLPKGAVYSVETMFCSRRDHVVNILTTHQNKGHQAAAKAYVQYNRVLNNVGESACWIGERRVSAIERTDVFLLMEVPNVQERMTLYILRVMVEDRGLKRNYFILSPVDVAIETSQ